MPRQSEGGIHATRPAPIVRPTMAARACVGALYSRAHYNWRVVHKCMKLNAFLSEHGSCFAAIAAILIQPGGGVIRKG